MAMEILLVVLQILQYMMSRNRNPGLDPASTGPPPHLRQPQWRLNIPEEETYGEGMDSCYGDHIELIAASVTFIYTFHTFSPIRRGFHLHMSDYNPLTATTGNSDDAVDYCYGDHMVHLTPSVTSPSSASSFPSLPSLSSSHRVIPAVVCFLNG